MSIPSTSASSPVPPPTASSSPTSSTTSPSLPARNTTVWCCICPAVLYDEAVEVNSHHLRRHRHGGFAKWFAVLFLILRAGIAFAANEPDEEHYRKQAAEVYRQAIKGDAEAQSTLASIYFVGRGVRVDSVEGVKWL